MKPSNLRFSETYFHFNWMFCFQLSMFTRTIADILDVFQLDTRNFHRFATANDAVYPWIRLDLKNPTFIS